MGRLGRSQPVKAHVNFQSRVSYFANPTVVFPATLTGFASLPIDSSSTGILRMSLTSSLRTATIVQRTNVSSLLTTTSSLRSVVIWDDTARKTFATVKTEIVYQRAVNVTPYAINIPTTGLCLFIFGSNSATPTFNGVNMTAHASGGYYMYNPPTGTSNLVVTGIAGRVTMYMLCSGVNKYTPLTTVITTLVSGSTYANTPTTQASNLSYIYIEESMGNFAWTGTQPNSTYALFTPNYVTQYVPKKTDGTFMEYVIAPYSTGLADSIGYTDPINTLTASTYSTTDNNRFTVQLIGGALTWNSVQNPHTNHYMILSDASVSISPTRFSLTSSLNLDTERVNALVLAGVSAMTSLLKTATVGIYARNVVSPNSATATSTLPSVTVKGKTVWYNKAKGAIPTWINKTK